MESEISIQNLTKVFKIKEKKQGLAKLTKFLKPYSKELIAVDNISIEIKKGELVGFIGPNGAGKSTTIKMLSGILFPTEGKISVANLDPQKERRILAYKIGTIFGQKPQLWFHLPAIDTFKLFSKIYDLDKKDFEKRLSFLVKKFAIGSFVDQPVRKLSLGQRMRCEFVLALLHKPSILFLDEPTIGMDLIVKKSIRELIKKINKEENVTVILTSHDMTDVEDVCDRAIIINEGTIVYDGSFEQLKNNFSSKKVIEIVSETKIKLPNHKSVSIMKKGDYSATVEIDTKKKSLKRFLDKLISDNVIDDITIKEQPIEEIIEEIYKKKVKK
jgi:ABC-2 type transport system ATP-binding protein